MITEKNVDGYVNIINLHIFVDKTLVDLKSMIVSFNGMVKTFNNLPEIDYIVDETGFPCNISCQGNESYVQCILKSKHHDYDSANKTWEFTYAEDIEDISSVKNVSFKDHNPELYGSDEDFKLICDTLDDVVVSKLIVHFNDMVKSFIWDEEHANWKDETGFPCEFGYTSPICDVIYNSEKRTHTENCWEFYI